ncbi:MAG: DNA/RNA non-specific endonuclease [Bryobacteraceae bacterium]
MSYFPQAAPKRPCYVWLDGQNRPMAIVGGVTVTDTGGRENPPPPVCGLNIDGTPLGRGHIMALQLGGPDVAENIVPQYQQWQQTGAWRQMEVQAAQNAFPNTIFVALLEYGNVGDANATGLHATFQSDDPVVYWDDFRIPTRFRIWLLPGGMNPGAQISADILAPGHTEGARAGAAAGLAMTLGTTPMFADFTVTEMPMEDYAFWMQNQAAMAVDESFEMYQHNFEAMSAPPSPHRETEVEYILGRGDEIRQVLENEHGWLAHDLNMYGSNARLLEAIFHERPLKARTNKMVQRREAEYQKKLAQWKGGKAPTHGQVQKMKKHNKPY